MSHFSLHVLLPKPSDRHYESLREYVATELDLRLAPFNENLEVAPYQETCSCVGSKARVEAEETARAKIGTIESLRTKFAEKYPELNAVNAFMPPPAGVDPQTHADLIERSQEIWQTEFTGPLRLASKEAFEIHPLKASVDPSCEECEGKGTRESTYNPKSQWDWFALGGRWNGSLVGHDPESDPENWTTCFLCAGTGIRPDGLARFGAEFVKETGCNGCRRTGKQLKYPSEQKSVGNILPVNEFLPRHTKDTSPFALLTPDGEWIERGSMGWWATVSGEKKRDVWAEEVRQVYSKFPDAIIALVDCHI